MRSVERASPIEARPRPADADNPLAMQCPRCPFEQAEPFEECPRCGVVVARVHAAPSPALQADIARAAEADRAERAELTARMVAVPAALAAAWLLVRAMPGAVRMLAMWVHESGHAVAAWLCGYLAWPGPWFTPVGTERSLLLTVTLVALLGYGGWRAWEAQRRAWLGASAAVVLLVLGGTFGLHEGRAQQVIIFSGDGGSFVLGTLLMLTVFSREESAVRREHLRWALLAIGALAFMDAYATWSGGIEAVPFGANEHGLSDPSVLAEEFGWSVLTLMRRYLALAHACLGVLAIAVVLGGVVPLLSRRRSL